MSSKPDSKSRSFGARLLRAREGAIVMTATHIFAGGLTIGLAVFRGTESFLSFHHEDLLTHANYGASKLGTDHARSSNSVATNNTISGAVMGPRLSVEAADIAVNTTGQIACSACNPYNSYMCQLCSQYNANNPRAIAKLAWSRVKQQFIWTSLSTLSGQMDKLASATATSNIASKISGIDSQVTMKTEDPATSQDIWGGDSSTKACDLATKDAVKSPVQDSAFNPSAILNQDLMPGGPTGLLAMLGQRICGAPSSSAGGASGTAGTGSQPNLAGSIPQIAKDTEEECQGIENQITQALSRAGLGGRQTGGWGGSASADNGGGGGGDGSDGSDGSGAGNGTGLQLSSTAQKYMTCNGSGSGGSSTKSTSSIIFRFKGMACYFDFNKCMDGEAVANSNDYLNSINIPNSVGSGLGGLGSSGGGSMGGGQSTRAPADSNWNQSPSFTACSHASKPVDNQVQTLTSAIRNISSFGQAQSSNVLSQNYDYASCAKTYFPDGSTSQFSSVQHDEQPFTAGWTSGWTIQGTSTSTGGGQ